MQSILPPSTFHIRWFVPLCLLYSHCTIAATLEWHGSLGATSEYVSRGLAPNGHRAAVQIALRLNADAWQTGITTTQSRQVDNFYASSEVNVYLGHYWQIYPDWIFSTYYGYYWYPNGKRYINYDYAEWSTALSFSDRLTFSVTFSPKQTLRATEKLATDAHTLAYQITYRQPLPLPVALIGSFGIYDLHDAFNKTYQAWSFGFERSTIRYQWSALYVDTDANGQALFPDRATPGRTLVSAALKF